MSNLLQEQAERPMTRAEWSALASLALAEAQRSGERYADFELLCRKCLARAEALFFGRVLP
jgi:hypothetical protein